MRYSVLLAALWTSPAAATEVLGPFDVPTDTGTVGVVLLVPEAGTAPPYAEGFPVAVMFAGTGTPDKISIMGCQLAEYAGFVTVNFVYPGGHAVSELCGHPVDVASTGTYQNRGGTDLVAARDAIRFALGDLATTSGETIQDVVGPDRPLDPLGRGIAGWSNGSGAATTILHNDGAWLGELGLRWFMSWEGAGSDQILTDELGRLAFDPQPTVDSLIDPDLEVDNEGWNPRWNPALYSYDTLPISYTQIRWDPTFQLTLDDRSELSPPGATTVDGILFFDGDGDGEFVTTGRLEGTDADGNGHLDIDEDWGMLGYTVWDADVGALRTYYSVGLTLWLEANDPFGADGWPIRFAHSAEAAAFWTDRDPLLHYPSVSADLRTVSVFSATHHAVTTRGHIETVIELEGLAAAGAWIRANPDQSYVAWAYALAGVALPDGIPETPAGIVPSVFEMGAAAEPSAIDDNLAAMAACRELTDRIHADNWDPDLDGILEVGGEIGTPPAETGDTAEDRVEPEPEPRDRDEVREGCGCASPRASASPAFLALALLARRRRVTGR